MSRAQLGLASLLALAAACGGDDQPAAGSDAAVVDAAPREVITATRSLGVLEIVEGIMAGGPGDHAVIHLSAPAPRLSWNIHGHASGATQVVDEGFEVMTLDYTFAPTAAADWFLLVRNDDAAPMDVDLRIELFGAMTWTWQ